MNSTKTKQAGNRTKKGRARSKQGGWKTKKQKEEKEQGKNYGLNYLWAQ